MSIALTAAAPAQPGSAAVAFDPAPWLADFERIKLGLAQGYANLDWQVDRRGINLARADGQIREMLGKATSDVQAALVIAKLVAAFDDPHVEIRFGPPPSSATLVLVGDQDTVTPPELSQELADAIPGAQFLTLAGAGHLSNIERPVDFSTAVQVFIERAEAGVE